MSAVTHSIPVGEPSSRILGLPDRTLPSDELVIFVAALLLRAELLLDVSPRVVRDGHRYVEWCADASLGTLFGTRALLYAGYWLPYCGFSKATGGWIDGWVAVQMVLSALTCVLVYRAGELLVDRWAGFVAGGAFVFQWEVYRWVTRAQSEFAMAFVLALALWRLAAYHTDATRRNRVLALASLGLVGLTRPNGLPIVVGYLAWDMWPASSDRRLNIAFSAPVNAGIAGLVVGLMWYRLRFGWAKGSALAHWKMGTIITPDRLVYRYTPESAEGLAFFVANAEHVVSIAVLRAVWFFSPVMPGYSLNHAVKSSVTLTPILIGAVLGIRLAYKRDRQLLVYWGTPLVMVLLTAVATWVAGWRNFLGPAAIVYALFTGYYVTESPWSERLRRYAGR